MDHPDSPGGGSRPPRKELQGPRPAPLKVRKESHKIRKPPVAPSAFPPQHQQLPPQPPRQPVIIYTVSPKVIHTHPNEFMTLVQRLTGPDYATTSSTSSSSSSYSQHHHHHLPPPSHNASSSSILAGFSSSSTTHHTMAHHISGSISPAARFASIEKTKMHSGSKKFGGPISEFKHEDIINIDVDDIGGGGGGGNGNGGVEGVERTMVFPGILSPGPGSLPPISPNLFSPFFHDPNNTNSTLNLQHDLNVVQHGNRSFIEGSYLPSPFSTNFTSPSTIISPSSLDFLQRVLNS
ncbi:protein MKS1 [Beta vulgaris subsp. vulgaris]|uniref:protein MKS1 n=1 Tax=Beta vulgaris subsp. vulgaris TaxID=3555 RepID=UPI002036F536|nr:protein MKS1 [Beta vulgaris subsp. vulgaris]